MTVAAGTTLRARLRALGEPDHRALGVDLGLFERRPGRLAWTAAGRLALGEVATLLGVDAREPEGDWLLDEVAYAPAVPPGFAGRVAAALGLGPVEPRGEDLRACDRLGRSWSIVAPAAASSPAASSPAASSPAASSPAASSHGGGVRVIAPACALAIVLEQERGALPLWLAPEQVRVLPVGPCVAEGHAFAGTLRHAGLRARVEADGPLASRVGAATAARVPYLAFLGPAEREGTVRIRKRGASRTEGVARATFIARALIEVQSVAVASGLPPRRTPALPMGGSVARSRVE